MNRCIYMGRLTRDPEVRYSQGDTPKAVARYTIAVDRPRSGSENTADFIPCVAFGKVGEFAERYLKKGSRILVEGHMQSGSYTNKEGQKVYTLDCIVERHEFAESKKSSSGNAENTGDEFMNVTDEELPFN